MSEQPSKLQSSESLSRSTELRELNETLAALAWKRARNRLSRYAPYPKQSEFHEAGAHYRERLLEAGNQTGKTFAGGAEVSMHLTGRYPDNWKGKRFDRPTTWLAGSETGELTRDGVQRILVGDPTKEEEWGCGAIPGDTLVSTGRAQGTKNALDNVVVRHVSGALSSLLFKSYAQGRQRWQANTVDGVWFDEEPPLEIYTEGITRTNVTMGPVILTFTPLLGMSKVVMRFHQPDENDPGRLDRHRTTMALEDVGHYSPEDRARIVASYPEHERDARTKGIPVLGSGVVFPVHEGDIRTDPVLIPPHWVRLGGMDFGYDHPFAAVEMCWDKDADVIYITKEYRQAKATPIIHAAAIKPWGDLLWAWPHDGLQHDKGSGEELAKQYKAQSLKMLDDRSTFPDGGNGVEAGIMEMLDRMQTGRWKVFSTCTKWFEEFRLYHRKDGIIVKLADDLLSASRYAMMMKRKARPVIRTARPAFAATGPVLD